MIDWQFIIVAYLSSLSLRLKVWKPIRLVVAHKLSIFQGYEPNSFQLYQTKWIKDFY